MAILKTGTEGTEGAELCAGLGVGEKAPCKVLLAYTILVARMNMEQMLDTKKCYLPFYPKLVHQHFHLAVALGS